MRIPPRPTNVGRGILRIKNEDGSYKDLPHVLAEHAVYTFYLGEGECSNYAIAMKWLLDGMNITNYFAIADIHAWNQVQIEGDWYNIDTTWGDPYSYWEENGVKYYMDPGKFLISDFYYFKTDLITPLHFMECTNDRFMSYMYTTKEPEPNGESVSYFKKNGKKYYSINGTRDYWLTDKWKKL